MKQLGQYIELFVIIHLYYKIYKYQNNSLLTAYNFFFGPCLQKNILWHFVGTRKMLAQQY